MFVRDIFFFFLLGARNDPGRDGLESNQGTLLGALEQVLLLFEAPAGLVKVLRSQVKEAT